MEKFKSFKENSEIEIKDMLTKAVIDFQSEKDLRIKAFLVSNFAFLMTQTISNIEKPIPKSLIEFLTSVYQKYNEAYIFIFSNEKEKLDNLHLNGLLANNEKLLEVLNANLQKQLN